MTPINGHSHYHSRVKGSFQGKQNGQSPPSAAAAAPDGRRFPQRDAWLSELSQELASITKVVLDSLEQVAPTQVIEHGREQFAGCSVSVPAPTLTAMYAALRMLQEVAENVPAYMQPLGHRDPLHEVVEDVFDIGDLLQTVGDTLSGLAATKGVELVIYHGDDSHTKDGSQTIKAVDSRSVYVQGNETGLLFVLVHIVFHTLIIADKGDSIELGLFMDSANDSYNTPVRCTIDIAHKFSGRDHRPIPNLETSLLLRLLDNTNAELRLDSLFRPQCVFGRACELAFTLPSVPPPEEIVELPRSFHDEKVAVTLFTRDLSTEPLMSSLQLWGIDYTVIGRKDLSSLPPERPEGYKSFLLIDDDLDTLKQQINLCVRPPQTKRPAIHRVQSSNNVTPRQPSHSVLSSTIIVFLSSLANFKFAKETVRASLPSTPFVFLPEVLIVPKPIGPRRLLTLLHTAIHKPTVDPSFHPNTASPNHSPTPGLPSSGLASSSFASSSFASSPSSEFKHPRPASARSNSDRSVSAVKENIPLSSPRSPQNEYFPPKICDNNPLTGIRIQDAEGASHGLYFNPKIKSQPSSAASSPAAVPPVSLNETFASMQDLRVAMPDHEPFLRGMPSPLEQIYLTRRTTTPHGSATTPRLVQEHNVVPPIKVLVVDDNIINRNYCKKALEKIGVASEMAVNGREALDKWRTGEFHMILMDIQMPVMSGLDATKHIRREEKEMALAGFPRGTPVTEMLHAPPRTSSAESSPTPYPSSVVIVALTASSDEKDRVEALAAGCNDFLTKPVSKVWLEGKVTEWGSIKALQQWAPPQLPETVMIAQEVRASSVAARLVPPTERRTPSPGQSKRRMSVLSLDEPSTPVIGRSHMATSSHIQEATLSAPFPEDDDANEEVDVDVPLLDDDMDVEPTPRLGEMEVDEDGNDFEMVDGEVDVVASEDETDMVAVEADASAAEADAKDVAVTRAVVTDVEMAGARSDIPGGPAPETAEHSEMGGGTH